VNSVLDVPIEHLPSIFISSIVSGIVILSFIFTLKMILFMLFGIILNINFRGILKDGFIFNVFISWSFNFTDKFDIYDSWSASTINSFK